MFRKENCRKWWAEHSGSRYAEMIKESYGKVVLVVSQECGESF